MVFSGQVFVIGSFVAACSAKVARLPEAGESLLAADFVLEPGGKGFNLAVGARRLGVEVDGLLAIGDDVFADFAAAACAKEGLPAAMLRRFAGATGAGVGFIDAAGENCLAVYPGANAKLSADDVAQAGERIAGAKLVLAQFETGDAPISQAFAHARQAGVPTLLNPSPYREIPAEMLENTSILSVNRVEAACLARAHGLDAQDRPGLARRLFARGVAALMVTLGADGAEFLTRDGECLRQPAFPAQVVDTLGAGDAFVAGFAAAMVGGHGMAAALRWAAACGACATEKLGVFEALPNLAELSRFLGA